MRALGLGLAIAAVLLPIAAVDATADGDVLVRVKVGGKKGAPDVAVRLGVKAWPNGRFEMRNHDAKTDAQGSASFAGVVPPGTRYGLYATAVSPGRTLVSAYVWYDGPAAPQPIDLAVEPAVPLRLRFVEDDGKPVGGVPVAPSMRADASGLRHELRGEAPPAATVESGPDGFATLAYFLPGEWAGVSVRFPGGDREVRTLLVPEAKDAVIEVPRTAPRTSERDLRAGGNADQRLFLFGPKAGDVEPAPGFGLVLVLPGGDGGEGFRDWVRERYDDWLDHGWVLAQLVAPKWEAEQKVVWPTEANRVSGMKFTTEQFVAAAVDEAARQVKVDRRRVVAVSWSSSGPACWRMLSLKKSPVTAHLIAMSVFHPQELEALSNGRKRPLFLLHSPEDRTCPIALAEQGRDAAKKAGLEVGWATYEGGHGWAGRSEDETRRGLHWLADALR